MPENTPDPAENLTIEAVTTVEPDQLSDEQKTFLEDSLSIFKEFRNKRSSDEVLTRDFAKEISLLPRLTLPSFKNSSNATFKKPR